MPSPKKTQIATLAFLHTTVTAAKRQGRLLSLTGALFGSNLVRQRLHGVDFVGVFEGMTVGPLGAELVVELLSFRSSAVFGRSSSKASPMT